MFKADKVTVDQQSGTGSVRLAFQVIWMAPRSPRSKQWQQKMAASPTIRRRWTSLLKLMKALLRGKPEFVLDTQAKLAQGEWQGKLTLNFQDPGAIDPAQDPMSLLGALQKGLADITASKPLGGNRADRVIAKQDLQAQLKGARSGSGRTGRANDGRAAGCTAASGNDGCRLRPTGRRSLPNHGAVRGWQVVRERSRNSAGTVNGPGEFQ
jgi:hypothetical protein